jgi:hypothetical protein
VVVASRPLSFDGKQLGVGPEVEETAVAGVDGFGFVGDLRPGEWVALHWDWVCDRITEPQRRHLARYTRHHLEITNRRLAEPRPHVLTD